MKKLIFIFLLFPFLLFSQTKNISADGENLVKKDASGNVIITGTTTFLNDIILSGDAATTIELRPALNTSVISGQANIPTAVVVGISPGYSLPIWNSDDEQLYFDIEVPSRWDGASDITAHLHCALATAQDGSAHTFQFQLTWDKFTTLDNEIIPTSGEHNVGVNTNTAISAAQYTSFEVDFTIDFDADTPDNIAVGDNIVIRLRRITETGDNTEITGEVIVTHLGLRFNRDKIGEW